MTSNLGTRSVRKGGIGFGQKEGQVDYKTMKSTMMEETKRLFTPEFLNRLDEIVVFRPLEIKHIEEIIDITMEELLQGMQDRNIQITLSQKVKEYLADKGYDPIYGARQVKRTLRKYVEDPIAEELLREKFRDGSHIIVKFKSSKLVFEEMEKDQPRKVSKKSVDKTKEVDPQK